MGIGTSLLKSNDGHTISQHLAQRRHCKGVMGWAKRGRFSPAIRMAYTDAKLRTPWLPFESQLRARRFRRTPSLKVACLPRARPSLLKGNTQGLPLHNFTVDKQTNLAIEDLSLSVVVWGGS